MKCLTTSLTLHSHEIKQAFLHSFTALLIVATGHDSNEHKYVMKTEVIDLGNSSMSCKPWADSDPVHYASGGFFSNGLTICGGGDPATNQCFQIRQNNTIPFTVSQKVASAGSSGVMIDQKEFLISGGWSSDGTLLNRSEILTTTEYLEETDLPFATAYHCMITTRNGTIFSTGGKLEYNRYTTSPYVWVWDKSTWKDYANSTLNQARFKHGCGSFSLHGTTFLVVAGGRDNDPHNSFNTTEFLNLAEESSKWVYGTYLKVVKQYSLKKKIFLSFRKVQHFHFQKHSILMQTRLCQMEIHCITSTPGTI